MIQFAVVYEVETQTHGNMLRLSPNIQQKEYTHEVEVGEPLSIGEVGTRDLVLANGYPLSSSPELCLEYCKEEPDGAFPSPQRYLDFIPLEGLHRTCSYDPNLFDIKLVSAEKIAEQLTLIDLALLKSIRMEEFYNCSFEKKDKLITTPNIVNFSRRFNHTSFWVVRDILNEESTKLRAETIVRFLRIGKRLHELNNIHSLVAVVLAIQSPPIHRLSLTWKLIPRKDRYTFEKLTEFISDEENYCHLREHMSKVEPPCIPHLGLHQKDLIYLDTLSKRPGATDEDRVQCRQEAEKVYELIRKFQDSKYDDLMPLKHIQKYLNSLRFIDELQKFYEDDNYKISMQREPSARKLVSSVASRRPPPHPSNGLLRSSKSQEDLLTTPLKPEVTGLFTPPRHTMMGRFSESDLQAKNRPKQVPQLKITEVSLDDSIVVLPPPGQRINRTKIQTLPTDMRDLSAQSLRKEGSKSAEPSTNNVYQDDSKLLGTKVKSASPSIKPRRQHGHSKSQSLGTNVLAALGIANSTRGNGRGSSPELPSHPISLLDDSVLDDTATTVTTTPGSAEYFTPPISTASSSSLDAHSYHSYDEESEVFLRDSLEAEDVLVTDLKDTEAIRDGILKRRVLFKNGRSTQLKLSHDYWVKLTPKSIILLPGKYKDSRKEPKKVKGMSVALCRVKYQDPITRLKDTQFLIVDERGNQTKFTANSAVEASSWVRDIRQAIDKEVKLLRKQVQERPLIKL